MVFALTGFFSATIDTSQQGQSKSTLENMMFKFQNGQVVFTGFDDVSNVYISRLSSNNQFAIFDNPAMTVGPEISFSDNFGRLKSCNFEIDKNFNCAGMSADSALQALYLDNSDILDDTPLMIQQQEFSFPNHSGSVYLYKFQKHGLVVTHDDFDEENEDDTEDLEPWITPFEMICYGIRKENSEEIQIMSIPEIYQLVFGNSAVTPKLTQEQNAEARAREEKVNAKIRNMMYQSMSEDERREMDYSIREMKNRGRMVDAADRIRNFTMGI